MSPFAYRAATVDGRIVSGEVEARSTHAARAELRRRGLFPVALLESAARRRHPGLAIPESLRPLVLRRPSTLEVTRELSALLAAGLTLDRSLALLDHVFRDPATAVMLRDLRTELRRGASWSDALATRPDVFPLWYVRVIAAGEEAGRLSAVVDALATYLDRRAELRERVRSSLVYPLVMAAVGGLTVLVLLVFVLPKFVAIFEQTEQSLPLATALLVGSGQFLGRFWWILGALGGVSLWGLVRWRQSPTGRRRLAEIDLAAPFWGSLRREALGARFARLLALLLGGGVPILVSIRTAARTLGNEIAIDRLTAVEERVRKGEGLAAALRAEEAPFPSLAVRMIGVGEEGGDLPDMLEEIARVFEKRVERKADRWVALLEPALVVAFGIVVAFVAVAMIQAIYSVQQVPL